TINGIEKRQDKQAFAHQFGYMPDDFQFQETLSARETIHFYARLKNVDKKRTKDVLQSVGLTEHQDKLMGAFSKGMRQRMLLAEAATLTVLAQVAFAVSLLLMEASSIGMRQRMLLAQALLTKPPLLILDEPTNGLDPYWVQTFSKMMIQAKQTGQSVIFSTHDLQVAEEIADEVIFLHNGEVLSKGPTEK